MAKKWRRPKPPALEYRFEALWIEPARRGQD
jgi:hypothetical protein